MNEKRGVPAPSHSRDHSSVSQSLLPFCPLFSTTRTLSVFLKQLLVVYFHVCFSVFLSEEENAQGQGTGQHLAQVGTAHAAEREQTASSRWRQEDAQNRTTTCTGRMEVTPGTQECDFDRKKENAGQEKPANQARSSCLWRPEDSTPFPQMLT